VSLSSKNCITAIKHVNKAQMKFYRAILSYCLPAEIDSKFPACALVPGVCQSAGARLCGVIEARESARRPDVVVGGLAARATAIVSKSVAVAEAKGDASKRSRPLNCKQASCSRFKTFAKA
jgi:hypothetical protein